MDWQRQLEAASREKCNASAQRVHLLARVVALLPTHERAREKVRQQLMCAVREYDAAQQAAAELTEIGARR